MLSGAPPARAYSTHPEVSITRSFVSATPMAVDAPLTVAFSGAGDDDDGTIVGCRWSMTDGATSGEQDPTHTFGKPGSFVATLTVTDDDGATATASVTIMV
ncbi:MAG: PKD domain-containing protein [Pseudomonadota bacterium]